MNKGLSVSEAEALAMLTECFNAPEGELHAVVLRDAVPGWDSMGALMLMAELDERFGVELTAEDSRAMKSVGDALAFMRDRGVLDDRA